MAFFPRLGDSAVRGFFELLQSDGYNPLVLTRSTFTLAPEQAEVCAALLPPAHRAAARALLAQEFTPGALAMFAEDCGLDAAAQEQLLNACVCAAHRRWAGTSIGPKLSDSMRKRDMTATSCQRNGHRLRKR